MQKTCHYSEGLYREFLLMEWLKINYFLALRR